MVDELSPLAENQLVIFCSVRFLPIIEDFGINRNMESDAANAVLVVLHLSTSFGDNNFIHDKVDT